MCVADMQQNDCQRGRVRRPGMMEVMPLSEICELVVANVEHASDKGGTGTVVVNVCFEDPALTLPTWF